MARPPSFDKDHLLATLLPHWEQGSYLRVDLPACGGSARFTIAKYLEERGIPRTDYHFERKNGLAIVLHGSPANTIRKLPIVPEKPLHVKEAPYSPPPTERRELPLATTVEDGYLISSSRLQTTSQLESLLTRARESNLSLLTHVSPSLSTDVPGWLSFQEATGRWCFMPDDN